MPGFKDTIKMHNKHPALNQQDVFLFKPVTCRSSPGKVSENLLQPAIWALVQIRNKYCYLYILFRPGTCHVPGLKTNRIFIGNCEQMEASLRTQG